MVARRLLFAALLLILAVVALHGAGNVPAATLEKTTGDSGTAFKHGKWPFFPPVRPVIPEVKDKAWVRNPIDAFILGKLEQQGLAPNSEADKLTLLRRVTFDLTGLPPTVAEQTAFRADQSATAYEQAVDRLLASPRYGEHWAQQWLDVVRYAETDGFKEDAHRPDAYKFRDWVIRALNSDLPFDRFVREQLAGDELEPDNPAALAATGYLRLYPDEYNAADIRQRRQEILDDLTDNAGLSFLGLTIGCAQCHNHKFDAILQTDYYRLQAFFTPMLPRDDLPDATAAEREKFAKQQAKWEHATAEIRAQIEALVAPLRNKARDSALEKFNTEVVAAMHTPDEKRSALQKQICYQAAKYTASKEQSAADGLKGEQKKRYDALKAQLAKSDSLKPAPLPTVRGVVDAGSQPPPTFRLEGGNLKRPAEQLEPGFPIFLGASAAETAPLPAAGNTTGRRTALAKWLTRPDNPMTARVLVNRLWQGHFGQGIVATPNDFGAAGEKPTHPELLDWLAVEFVESGWSMKAMHRLMVTSAAYRQSAIVDPKNAAQAKALAADSGNKLLWHARRQRLTGEALRDSVLFVAGDLNEKMYGPSARPELPEGLGNHAWQPDPKPEDRNRRSIYVLAKRNLRLPLLDAFDLPDMHNSCSRRSTTTTAPQALLMLNSDFALTEARQWAGRLRKEARTDDALIVAAYTQAYARQPTPAELEMCEKFIAAQAAGRDKTPPKGGPPTDPHAAAVVDFCHAILNSNEFLYVD
jgi:hypothetical protein